MSKEKLTAEDKKLADAVVGLYKSIDKMTKLNIEFSERNYKFYMGKVVDLQEELDNTPKLFKKKRAKLEQEIEDMQAKVDKHFNDYMLECQDLYDLHNS